MTVLLVLATILLFVLIDFVYRKVTNKAFVTLPETSAKSTLSEFFIPQNVFFGKGHTWASLKSNGKVQIGIDSLVSNFIGDIEKITTKNIGEEIKKGEPLFTIESKGRKISIASPISGTLLAMNENIMNDPSTLSTNPYDRSWLCMVEPKNLSYELKLMKVADEAKNWLQNEINRFKEFISSTNTQGSLVGATLYDGGVPVQGVMQHLDENTCKKFEQEFLSE